MTLTRRGFFGRLLGGAAVVAVAPHVPVSRPMLSHPVLEPAIRAACTDVRTPIGYRFDGHTLTPFYGVGDIITVKLPQRFRAAR